MTEIVFIVDGFDREGNIVTAMDRVKSISDNWQPNLFDKNKKYYQQYTGDKIKFVKKSDITSYDPNKKYFYFIPMNDFHCTIQMFFNILSKDMQKEFADNNVALYFCQDFEMFPNLEINFFGTYLSWVMLCQAAHSFPEIKIYFAMCADIVPKHKKPLVDFFGDKIKFVNSPLLLIFSREELAIKNHGLDISSIVNDYINAPKNKMYMSLTRDPKYHRISLLHGLKTYGLLNDGYISYLMPRPYDNNHIKSDTNYAARVKLDIQHSNFDRLIVDELDPAITPGIYNGIGGDIPFQQMATSCYDLIQETATNYEVPNPIDMAIITEKTVKSLLFGRPFMINGGQGSLSVLKRWGFATYDNIFDEKYDDLENFIDRQEVLVSNVNGWKGRHDDFMSRVRQEETLGRIHHNIKHVLDFKFEEYMIPEIMSA